MAHNKEDKALARFEASGLSTTSTRGIPQLVLAAGSKASRRFIEFFTVEIRNANTRAAYHRAVTAFADWCDDRGVTLRTVNAVVVAAYIEELQQTRPKSSVKQALAAIRMLFDYMVIGHIIESNPAKSVRGPKYTVRRGKTPVLDAEQARILLDSIDTSTIIGLRDRAIIASMVYTFARVGAVVGLRVEDYFAQGKRWWLRLHEKNGKTIETPAHHNLEGYLDEYIDAAGIRSNRKGPLFRTVEAGHNHLTDRPMTRVYVWSMIKRRAKAAGIPPEVCCHTFRATGITTYLKNGGTLEKAQYIAGHESARTTSLYDRRKEDVSLDEVERVAI